MMKKFKLLSVLASAMLLFSLKPDANTGYKIGDKVKDFSLKNVDGKMVSLADYKNAKGVIVIFTCNHCPFSMAYEDRIILMHNENAANGYPVIAINPNDPVAYPSDSYDEMVKRANEKNYPFAYVVDETQQVAKQFGATRTPHVFLLKKEKKDFTVEYIGAIDDNSDDASAVKTKYVENAIADLNAAKKPATNFTKAIGCTIKWKK